MAEAPDAPAPAPAEAPAPETPAPAAPAQEEAKADAPKREPGPAARKLAELRERKAAKAAEREAAKAAASNVDPVILDHARRWQAHEKAEAKRIGDAAAGLDAEDRALIDGEKDLGRKAALLARLTKAAAPAAAAPAAPKAVAKPGPTGAPPSVTSIDLAEAIKTPEGLAAAKASDPEGFARKFSAMLRGTVRKSTLDVAAGR